MQNGKPKRKARIVALVLFTIFAAWSLRIILWSGTAVTGDIPNDGYIRIPGVVHVHTTFSDGGGSPDEVIASAKRAGLRFVAITDHNNQDAKSSAGYHDDVLVLVGSEISTVSGHLLALGLDDPLYRFSGDLRDALDDVQELGGVSFAAHPFSPVDAFRWKGWDLPGSWGMEILSGDSEWREAGWGRFLQTMFFYGLNKRYALLTTLNSPQNTLARWDTLLAKRDVAGLVGTDAHSRVALWKGKVVLRFPAYEVLFSLAQNHVVLKDKLSGNAATDSAFVVRALSQGHSYVGLDALAPANDFSFYAERKGQRWTMGDTVPAGGEIVLRAGGKLAKDSQIQLIRNGKSIQSNQNSLEFRTADQGTYRIEVRVQNWKMPWIVSNPIYIYDDSEAELRKRKAQAPATALPADSAELIDAFEGKTGFVSASDKLSTINKDVVDPSGGTGESGAAKMAFHLALPTAANPDVYCAIVDYQKRDFTGKHGLLMDVRADGVYRTWVQVRDENPASKEEKTEWWFASVKTSRDWQRIAVPFSKMRSINKNTDGKLDLDKVVAIVFVMDKAAMKPGASGTIWIDNLSLY